MTPKWIIPGIPNTGHKLFCLVNSLQMLFQYHGGNIPLHHLIPLSGVAFGFRYFNDGRFVHPVVVGCTCAAGMAFASEQLGYKYDVVADPDWKIAWGRIRAALTSNLPVAVGPVPYAILSYNPKAGDELRGDHFCVLCGFDEEQDMVWVNDPDGFSYAPLRLSALQSVWQNPHHQCPVLPQAPLALIVSGRIGPDRSGENLRAILSRACRLMTGEIIYDPLEGRVPPRFMFTGVPGMEKLAADIRQHFDGANERKLAQITRRMQEVTFLQGTQAKADIAHFLRYWTGKLHDKEAVEQLNHVVEYYEKESWLHLEAVKTCSLVTRAIAAGTGIDEPWQRLIQIVAEIATIERDTLMRLEKLLATDAF